MTELKPPQGYAYVPVKKATGVDVPGVIAVPLSELSVSELFKIYLQEIEDAKNGK